MGFVVEPKTVKAWIRRKVVEENRKKKPKKPDSSIVIAVDPNEVAGKPSIRVPATCPHCRKKIEIFVPKKTVKKFHAMFKRNVSGGAKVRGLKPIVGHSGLQQAFKRKQRK